MFYIQLDKTKLDSLQQLKTFVQEYVDNFNLIAKNYVRENFFAVKVRKNPIQCILLKPSFKNIFPKLSVTLS